MRWSDLSRSILSNFDRPRVGKAHGRWIRGSMCLQRVRGLNLTGARVAPEEEEEEEESSGSRARPLAGWAMEVSVVTAYRANHLSPAKTKQQQHPLGRHRGHRRSHRQP